MSNDINRVIIAGRLVKDPIRNEVNTQTGVSTILKFTIANQTFKANEGSFFDCTIWGKKAEFFSSKLVKGTPVLIEGELKQDRWKDKNSGENRSKIVINVINLYVLSYEKSSFSKNADYERSVQMKNDDDIPVTSVDDINGESFGGFNGEDPFAGHEGYDNEENNYFN